MQTVASAIAGSIAAERAPIIHGGLIKPSSRERGTRNIRSLAAPRLCALGVGRWLWALGFGLWALGAGLTGLGCGLWALGPGLWALGSWLWALGSGLWALGSGLWALGSGLWALKA